MHGRAAALRVDNGPEFIGGGRSSTGATTQGIALRYIQPGKPDQNAYIERFNRSYRQEVLDAYVFDSIEEVRGRHGRLARGLQHASGPTTASAGCRRSRSCRGHTAAGSLSYQLST